jgi:hypothetical protein
LRRGKNICEQECDEDSPGDFLPALINEDIGAESPMGELQTTCLMEKISYQKR